MIHVCVLGPKGTAAAAAAAADDDREYAFF